MAKGGKCEICNLSDKRVLEFHHNNFLLDRKETNKSIERYLEYFKNQENMKLLCANCHRILHYNELQKMINARLGSIL